MSDSEFEHDNLNDKDYEPSSGEESSGGKKAKRRKETERKSHYRRIDFNETDEERLIELIKSKEYLYNVPDQKYKDRTMRNKAWDDISKSLKKSSEDCKKKWKNMKDQYDRTRKKQPTGSGTSSSQAKRMDILSFLDSCSTVNTKYDLFLFCFLFFL